MAEAIFMNARLVLVEFHFAGVLMEKKGAMVGFDFFEAVGLGKADLVLDEFEMNRRADGAAVLLGRDCFHSGVNWRKLFGKKRRAVRVHAVTARLPITDRLLLGFPVVVVGIFVAGFL